MRGRWRAPEEQPQHACEEEEEEAHTLERNRARGKAWWKRRAPLRALGGAARPRTGDAAALAARLLVVMCVSTYRNGADARVPLAAPIIKALVCCG